MTSVEKSAKYWPDHGTGFQKFGHIKVKTTQEVNVLEGSGATKRVLELEGLTFDYRF